jgi:hypothetical protein
MAQLKRMASVIHSREHSFFSRLHSIATPFNLAFTIRFQLPGVGLCNLIRCLALDGIGGLAHLLSIVMDSTIRTVGFSCTSKYTMFAVATGADGISLLRSAS